jgi:S1-C subfamily serine protease
VLLAGLALGPLVAASPGAETGALDSALRATVYLRVIGDVEIVAGSGMTAIGETRIERTNVEIATGSGFLISGIGQVLTCHHVISDGERTGLVDGKRARVAVKVRRIDVVFSSAGSTEPSGVPQQYEATVIAASPDLDLAVLSISGANFPSVDLGDSDAMEPGDSLDTVGYPFGQEVEIGRPVSAKPDAPDASISHGDFSAYRTDTQGLRRFIQTSAAVNPGNSGGPVLDTDGYVVGIVSRRLASAGAGTGIGFAVPINLVKEFLEANGLDGQLPARRVALGPVQAFDAKGLRLRLPWGVTDTSPFRTRLDTGGSPLVSPVLHIDRLVSPWDVSRLVDALARGQAVEPFSPSGTPLQRSRQVEGRRTLTGRVNGTWQDGTPARMEFAVVDLGQEKILARYVGPPNLIAYNASTFRASLASIAADVLRKGGGTGTRSFGWAPALGSSASSRLSRLPVPAGWIQEPDGPLPCEGLQEASDVIAASPPGDFTQSVRAGLIRQPGVSAARAAAACGTVFDDDPSHYQRAVVSLGARQFVEGRFLQVGPDEVLHYEVTGPVEHQAPLREVLAQWTLRLAEFRRIPAL